MNEYVKNLCILLSEKKSMLFNHSPGDHPRWFSLPLEELAPVSFCNTFAKVRKAPNPKTFLFFNISFLEVLVTLCYSFRAPICSLFQWIPLEQLPRFKRFCYRLVLSRSKVIVVYNQIAYEYIKKRFPRKKVHFLKLWVDCDYFAPQPQVAQERFLLCPGSHRRDENMVCRIAEAFNIKIVRFSQNPNAIAFYKEHPHPLVDFRYNISFNEMRQLYNDAAVVLNIVDDSQIPAGLTCFVEALAMGATTITPEGHSSAGYTFADGGRPYYTLPIRASEAEWIQKIDYALNHPLDRAEVRKLAVNECGIAQAGKVWQEVLGELQN